MSADAVDTVITLGWALLAWIALLMLTAVLALHAVVAVLWTVGRRAGRTVGRLVRSRRALSAPLSHEQAESDHRPARTPERRSAAHVPSWATQQPITYEEAA